MGIEQFEQQLCPRGLAERQTTLIIVNINQVYHTIRTLAPQQMLMVIRHSSSSSDTFLTV